MRDFGNAIKWYHAAMAINPRLACTYSALGFTHHLQGDLDKVPLPLPCVLNHTTQPQFQFQEQSTTHNRRSATICPSQSPGLGNKGPAKALQQSPHLTRA